MLPYTQEVKIIGSPEGFKVKYPAGGSKIVFGLGASQARREAGVKVALATGVSAGGLLAAIDTNDVDPKQAALAIFNLLQLVQKDLSVLSKSFVGCDPLLLLLSGFTSLSPEYCFQTLIDELGLKWNSKLRIISCAVEVDVSKPWSLTPWTLTNYRHWPIVITEADGIPLARALWYTGAVPGTYVTPRIGTSERGLPLIAVDGAFVNRIPHVPGDGPSIAMSYTRATSMPKDWTDLPNEGFNLAQEWLMLFQPVNWFNPASSWERTSDFVKKASDYFRRIADYSSPSKIYGLMQQVTEIYVQICGNNNVQMPGDFPIVLGMEDFAALNTGISEKQYWAAYDHGLKVGRHRFAEGLAAKELVVPS
jgi:hypothetical protein